MSLQNRKTDYKAYNSPAIPVSSGTQARRLAIVTNENSNNVKLETSLVDIPSNVLPAMATANDVREIVRFLQYMPSGITFTELVNAEPRRIFEARKIAAYEVWGVIKCGDQRIELTELGRKLAKAFEPEKCVYFEILRSVEAYINAIEWFESQQIKIVTHFDVANLWQQTHPGLKLDEQEEKDVEAMVVSFFSLCHNAELGTMTIGKRGQPARLRIEPEKLRQFLKNFTEQENQTPKPAHVNEKSSLKKENQIKRIYLSAKKPLESLNHLREILELADFESVMMNGTNSESSFILRSQLTIMEHCHAGILLLDEESCIINPSGNLLKNDVLLEINAALTLYNWRVVVCWIGQLEAPRELRESNLEIVFTESLGWETNLQIVQTLKKLNFR